MSSTSSQDPARPLTSEEVLDTYRKRIAALRLDESGLQRRHLLWGYTRLLIGFAVLFGIFRLHWLVLPAVLVFALVARVHGAVLRELAAVRRTISSLLHASAKVEDRWQGLQPRATRIPFTSSLFAEDLDLFGPGSVFELLCTARTSLGEDTLASWLLRPAPLESLRERQDAVRELCSCLSLREAMAGARGPLVAVLDAPTLALWAESTSPSLPKILRWLASGLVLIAILAAWRSIVSHSWLPFSGVLLVNACVIQIFRKRCMELFAGLQDTHRKLSAVADMFAILQREVFSSSELQKLRLQMEGTHTNAASALRQLASLAAWAESYSNYVVRILDIPLLYSIQVALAVQRWRAVHGQSVKQWLEVLGQYEALLSLASYSFEHPLDTFPQFKAGPAVLVAQGLGHPLLPRLQSVRNDVTLDSAARLLLISGSNMSGKSTLLRAVGVNTALSYAGAPACAASFHLSAFTLASSIQIHDSLQAGKSRFFSEILRLRDIVEAARQQPPVLFLVDELLSGTNSADRLAGAEALVRELLRNGAMGMLTTHDLALTSLISEHADLIRNAHFEDQVTATELRFDYKLREGVVKQSNALALMRLVGLDV